MNDPRLGRTLGEKYRIDSLLGQGGLGRVYRATHVSLGSAVAVKYLLATPHADEARARFRREATVLAALRHPGIVAAHDFGDDDGEPYLVMELVDGVSLAEAILPGGVPMPFRRIAAIAQQIARVLETAHAAKIVHRDLKPDNVMLVDLGGADHVKVLDFGIALMLGDDAGPRLTATNAFQGTPSYMSPEQWRGRDVGPETDVYALGAVLYEMLSGEPPFDGESPADVMAKHMFVPPPPIEERGVGRVVPPDLEALALGALAKKPEERPTVTEVLDALEAYARGTSTMALAQRSTEERIRAGALSRRERGLPAVPTPLAERREKLTTPGATASHGLAHLWGFDEARAESLVVALGMNGVTARTWRGDGPPVGAKAVVLAFDGAIEKLAALAPSKLPAVVADVASAADTPSLVRAGASDVALATIGDDALCAKVVRVIRRGR